MPHGVAKNIYVYIHICYAKSLQLCPTLCNPIDGSPPGSAISGILQARILEWVAISFSNAWKWKVKVKSLSPVRHLATPWTAAYQAPLSMGFARQEYWSGVPLPSLIYIYIYCKDFISILYMYGHWWIYIYILNVNSPKTWVILCYHSHHLWKHINLGHYSSRECSRMIICQSLASNWHLNNLQIHAPGAFPYCQSPSPCILHTRSDLSPLRKE